jgi:hypothetical protein
MENLTQNLGIKRGRKRLFNSILVHHFRDWYSSVAIKMGRQQGATKEPI